MEVGHGDGENPDMDAIQERDDDDLDEKSEQEAKGSQEEEKVDATGKESIADSRAPSDSKLLQVEVSILDLDRDGSVNLEKFLYSEILDD